MKTTDLYDSRSPKIHTEGREMDTHGFCDLRVDAGFRPEDPDHSRGYVRLELDRETEPGGGIATRVLRAATVRNGVFKDVLEIHTLGECETAAFGRALVFAGKQLLGGVDSDLRDERDDVRASAGILHDSPNGSVWKESK